MTVINNPHAFTALRPLVERAIQRYEAASEANHALSLAMPADEACAHSGMEEADAGLDRAKLGLACMIETATSARPASWHEVLALVDAVGMAATLFGSDDVLVVKLLRSIAEGVAHHTPAVEPSPSTIAA